MKAEGRVKGRVEAKKAMMSKRLALQEVQRREFETNLYVEHLGNQAELAKKNIKEVKSSLHENRVKNTKQKYDVERLEARVADMETKNLAREAIWEVKVERLRDDMVARQGPLA